MFPFQSPYHGRMLICPSVQILNSYVDDLSRGNEVTTSQVEFFVEEDKQLIHIVAELPSYGSLGPLFYAFGLITAEELSKGVGAYHGGTSCLVVYMQSRHTLVCTINNPTKINYLLWFLVISGFLRPVSAVIIIVSVAVGYVKD